MFSSPLSPAKLAGFICLAACCVLMAATLGAAPSETQPAKSAASGWLEEAQRVNAELPEFWTSTVDDVRRAPQGVKAGTAEVVARSPGGREVYLVSYGQANDIQSLAYYNSACAARNPAWYAHKPVGARPTVLIVGPVHGSELEGVVGTLNLISLAETGHDLRGREWPKLLEYFRQCRVLIIPLSNPDGRARCPFNSFCGVSIKAAWYYGMGTHTDGSQYGYPDNKGRQPMTGDVGLLGAYYNDAGVNLMHDNWFGDKAPETAAILEVARREAPDCIIVMHSHGAPQAVYGAAYVPLPIKEKTYKFAEQLAARFDAEGVRFSRPRKPGPERRRFPPSSFNLTSALHHVCGGMSFTWECSQGFAEKNYRKVTLDQLLDIQLTLFEEMFKFAVENPVEWPRSGRP